MKEMGRIFMHVVERMGLPLFIQAVAELSFEIVLLTIIISIYRSLKWMWQNH